MAWKPEMTDRSTFLGKKKKKNYQSDQFKSYLLCPPKTKVHCRKGGQTQGKIRNQNLGGYSPIMLDCCTPTQKTTQMGIKHKISVG